MSLSSATSAPVNNARSGRPSAPARCRTTAAPSPDRILTRTPAFSSRVIASAASGLGGIDENTKTGDDQIAFVFRQQLAASRRHRLPGHCQDVIALRRLVTLHVLQRRARGLIDRQSAAVGVIHSFSARKNFLRGTLYDQHACLIFFNQHRNSPTLEVER